MSTFEYDVWKLTEKAMDDYRLRVAARVEELGRPLYPLEELGQIWIVGGEILNEGHDLRLRHQSRPRRWFRKIFGF